MKTPNVRSDIYRAADTPCNRSQDGLYVSLK